jgi:hypothetical protein
MKNIQIISYFNGNASLAVIRFLFFDVGLAVLIFFNYLYYIKF